ncbi:hypothetical protein GCM10009000_060000 [Halobacterium noricense]|uniref:Uncharacterized protein n=1 Tax=Haladaptatus pallidirubidus TaxID=1008152 RepID=A0AAV3UIJ3_9EURY
MIIKVWILKLDIKFLLSLGLLSRACKGHQYNGTYAEYWSTICVSIRPVLAGEAV